MLLEPIEFRTPIATIKFSNGREMPITFDQVWQRRFKALWQLLGGLVDDAELGAEPLVQSSRAAQIQQAADSAQVLARPDANAQRIQQAADLSQVLDRPAGNGRIEEAKDEIAIMDRPPRAPFDIKDALLAIPVRRDRNVFTFIPDTAANLTNYQAAAYPSAIYFETDTFVIRWSDGSGWTEFIFPALIKLLGSTAAFPALKRSAAILQARLANDSAYTDMEVLDQVYDATSWNGSVTVPTKNAVRDKIETVTGGETGALVSDTAYAASWDGVGGIAPSKNAVYDKVETLLSKNGVNFGPAPVVSITVVNGQITAIS